MSPKARTASATKETPIPENKPFILKINNTPLLNICPFKNKKDLQ
jgi:hypothetical protein